MAAAPVAVALPLARVLEAVGVAPVKMGPDAVAEPVAVEEPVAV
jgi:hypothetical protein